MADEADSDLEEQRIALEAIGAFAHELRTPLTSMRMLIELARMQSPEDELHLRGDLPQLLYQTVGSLERLADELQELSRIDRGRVTYAHELCDLEALVRQAADEAGAIRSEIRLAGAAALWSDAARLRSSLAKLIVAADHSGDGSGQVRVEIEGGEAPRVRLESGVPGGPALELAADMGFGFFAARRCIAALGGLVLSERREGFLAITVLFPPRTV